MSQKESESENPTKSARAIRITEKRSKQEISQKNLTRKINEEKSYGRIK